MQILKYVKCFFIKYLITLEIYLNYFSLFLFKLEKKRDIEFANEMSKF